MTLLTSTALTETARKKATDATGIDPGPWAYRLHRDTCDRVRGADSPREVNDHVADYANQIVASKDCARCKPRDTDELRAAAQAATEQAEAQHVEVEAVKAVAAANARDEQAAEQHLHSVPQTTDGDVLGLTPSVYPAQADDQTLLWCAGHHEYHPAKKFTFVVNKADGRRAVECSKAWNDRLAWTKEHADAKKPSPRLPAERVQPKA